MKKREGSTGADEITNISWSFKTAAAYKVKSPVKMCNLNDPKPVGCIEDVSLLHNVKHPLWYVVGSNWDSLDNKIYFRCICLNCRQLVDLPKNYFDNEEVINSEYSSELLTKAFHEYKENHNVNPTHNLEVKTLLKRIKK